MRWRTSTAAWCRRHSTGSRAESPTPWNRCGPRRIHFPLWRLAGGSVLLERELPGLGTVIRPERFDVANAIGAAIAQVSGEVDRVEAVRDGHRQVFADDARQEAIDRAVAAGARPESVQIVEFDEVPIPYLPGNATRIRVKAVGDLALHSGLVSTGQEGSR